MNLVTTKEAAEILGVSVRRVRAMIEDNKISAHRLGRDYAIEREVLDSVKVYGKAGRPPKHQADNKKSNTTKKANNL